jgi:hypothetical protein
MILLGGWALAGSNRADTLLYSRYIDPWSVPLVIFAITALEKKEVTRRVYVLGVMLVTCSLVTVLYLATEATITGRRIMTLPLGFLWRVSGDRLEIVACLAAAIVFCGLVTSKFSWYVPAVILTILAGISVILNNQHLAEVGRVSKGQSTVTEMIPMSEKCISYDTETIKPYAIWLYRLQLPNLEHNAVKLSSVESLCGDYVIADREALIDCTTAELIKKEPRAKWGLWIYPNRGCP